jgi:hypothetical protein
MEIVYLAINNASFKHGVVFLAGIAQKNHKSVLPRQSRAFERTFRTAAETSDAAASKNDPNDAARPHQLAASFKPEEQLKRVGGCPMFRQDNVILLALAEEHAVCRRTTYPARLCEAGGGKTSKR